MSSMELDLWPYVEDAYRDELGRITAALDELEQVCRVDSYIQRAIDRFTSHSERQGDRAIIERFLTDVVAVREAALHTVREVNPNLPHHRHRLGAIA